MTQTIICSVGTSAAKGVCPPNALAKWITDQGGAQQGAATLFARVKDTAPVGEALQTTLSAEVHSLVRMGICDQDRVLLLASDTPDGEACASAVAMYLEHHFAGVKCDVERVAGLQVHDAERFRREGVVNFVDRCLKAVNNYGNLHSVLNPTGGFKALVPYTVLVGMLKRVPCKYIFEQSTSVLTLPPLPVTIDRGPFERYRSLLEAIERDTHLPLARWTESVRHDEQQFLEPLVEICGNQVTLSGVGILFLDELRTPTTLVPFMSRQAWSDCLDNLCQLNDCDPFRFISRIAADPVAFKLNEHINLGAGFRWMKPGRTTDRYLVSVEGWRLLVWRVIREDEEGSNYPQRITVNPTTDRQRLGPFTRLEFANSES